VVSHICECNRVRKREESRDKREESRDKREYLCFEFSFRFYIISFIFSKKRIKLNRFNTFLIHF
jgi:hypothetical protein